MGFIMDGLDSEPYDRTYTDRELLRRILRFFRPQAHRLSLVAFSLFLNSAAGAAAPVLISRIIDWVASRPSPGLLAASAAGVAALGGLGWMFSYLHERLLSLAVGEVVLNLRSEAFAKVLGHDLSFFDENASGRIVSRLASDTQDFSNTVSLVTDLSSQFLQVVLLAVWLFLTYPSLALQLLAMAPAAALIALAFRRAARAVTLNAKKVTAGINSQIQEAVAGITVAKTFRQEKTLYQAFLANNRLAYRVGLQRGIVLNTIFPVVGIAAGFATAILAYSGGLAVRSGGISPGSWYLFMQAVGFFWWPMLSIASFWSQFQDGLAAAERVFALMDAEPRVRQSGSRKMDRLQGSVEFRSLSLSYPGGPKVLDRFSLKVEPGEFLAVVGPTGAGKTSLARLIGRFYEFQEGELLVDGGDIRTLDLESFRRQLGYVPQDPFLFAGSVADNIRYGRPEAGDEEVTYAASHLGRGDWLESLPRGLATDAGERGAGISFGQRQLVALARILLKDPAIFILDEATASVDPVTEAQIQEALEALRRNRTTLVIAHRLTTVKSADRIIVLEHGRILEQGTHAELLARGGSYAGLYTTYFRHQSLEYIEEAGRLS